jgi:type IV secretory pathway VirJ component
MMKPVLGIVVVIFILSTVYVSLAATKLCLMVKQVNMKASEVKGGHHFGGDYQALVELILKHAKLP